MQPDGEHRSVGEQIEEALNDAISETLSKFEGSFVTKWVVALEVMQPNDGERGVWTFVAPGMMRWDIQGMLKELADFQTAHHIVQILEEHGHGGH